MGAENRLRWVSDKTKIVFSGGEELKVDGQPKQVRDRLSRKGVRFARFNKKTGAANVDVWVAVGQVARSSKFRMYSGKPRHLPFRTSPPILRQLLPLFSAQCRRGDTTVDG